MSEEVEQISSGESAVAPLPAEPGFGGSWLPEIFRPALAGIEDGARRIVRRRAFRRRLRGELERFAGRPTPLFVAEGLTAEVGGAKILCKREDRLESGSRHLTAALGQALLARTQGRTRILGASATGAGAVAIAAAAARCGLESTVFAGVEDLRVREGAFSRAETLGAEIVPVDLGRGGVEEALQVALSEWCADSLRSQLVLTSPVGPEPFPSLVAELESTIGLELATQMKKRRGKSVPDLVVSPLIGGGTVGAFSPWIDSPATRLIGTAATSVGAETLGASGRPTVIHGSRTLVLPPEDAPTVEDRPQRYRAMSPYLAEWIDAGRVGIALTEDRAARDACRRFAETEGILVSLQSGEVLAEACERASRLGENELVVAVLSGRGHDDIGELSAPLPEPVEPLGPIRDVPIERRSEAGGEEVT